MVEALRAGPPPALSGRLPHRASEGTGMGEGLRYLSLVVFRSETVMP